MPPKHVHESTSSEEEEGVGTNMQKFFDVAYSTKFMSSLPDKVRQRAQVLMSYHEDFMKLQASSELEEMEIRRRYDEVYAPFFARRREIISGSGDAVTEEEIRKGYPAEHEGKVTISVSAHDANEAPSGTEEGEKVNGLPGFWLRVLQNHVLFDCIIQDHDVAVLNYLIDVSSHTRVEDGIGSFDVVFTFAPNEFLVENTLTMSVVVRGDNSDIRRSPPTWQPGKNVTVETITKKQRAKRSGQTRTITREEPRDSFFSYLFAAPDVDKEDKEDNNNEENEDEDKEEKLLHMMYELRTKIIPGAVNYYTGEAPDGSSDIEDDDDNDAEDEEEENEEEEEDVPVRPVRRR